MEPHVAAKLLAIIESPIDVQDADLPHILVVIDPVTYRASARGPYPNGLDASRAAIALKAELNQIGDGQPPIEVVPIPVTMVMTEELCKQFAKA